MISETPLVLIVDDNEMNRDMLARRLQRQNCEVVLAENGTVALEMMKTRAFNLVLLDIMMPGISGYEVLEQLKADPAQRHIPIIMISAVDDLDSVVKCIEMGAEDYLFKPFNPVLLKARVSASLIRHRQQGIDVPAARTLIEHIRAEANLIAVPSPTDQQTALSSLNANLDALTSLLSGQA